MLPKKHRISKELFVKLCNPRRLCGRFSSISVYSLPHGEDSKAACVVSRKISGSAVVRNRLRRRFYAALQPIVKRRGDPRAIVVYPKREAVAASYEDIERDVVRMVRES